MSFSPLLKHRGLRWMSGLTFLALVTGVAVLGSLPSAAAEVPHPFSNFDKVLHFTVFAMAAALLWLSQRRPSAAIVWCAVAGLGVLDEAHQYFLPFRSCDIWDLLTDFAATGVAVLVLRKLSRRRGLDRLGD